MKKPKKVKVMRLNPPNKALENELDKQQLLTLMQRDFGAINKRIELLMKKYESLANEVHENNTRIFGTLESLRQMKEAHTKQATYLAFMAESLVWLMNDASISGTGEPKPKLEHFASKQGLVKEITGKELDEHLESQKTHDNMIFLAGVEFGVREHEKGSNLQLALEHAQSSSSTHSASPAQRQASLEQEEESPMDQRGRIGR